MILKFIQAESKQPVLIMSGAIVGVEGGALLGYSEGTVMISTMDTRRFIVLGTVEQIELQLRGQAGMSSVAIAPVGG